VFGSKGLGTKSVCRENYIRACAHFSLTKCRRKSQPGDEHMAKFRYFGITLTSELYVKLKLGEYLLTFFSVFFSSAAI
jgi:hypothetical protein